MKLFFSKLSCRYDEIISKLKPYLKKTGFKANGKLMVNRFLSFLVYNCQRSVLLYSSGQLYKDFVGHLLFIVNLCTKCHLFMYAS